MPPLPTGKSPKGDPDRRLPYRRLPQRHFLKGSLKAFPSGIPIGISLRNPSGPGPGRAQTLVGNHLTTCHFVCWICQNHPPTCQ